MAKHKLKNKYYEMICHPEPPAKFKFFIIIQTELQVIILIPMKIDY